MTTTRLVCHAQDQVLSRYGSQLAAIGKKAPIAMRDALNREGRKGRKEIRQALVRQTGLKPAVIRRAIDPHTTVARVDRLTYQMVSYGGNISLKFFSPRETRTGVRHRSPNQESPVAGSFMLGGSFAKGRKGTRAPVNSGHVWARDGGARKFPLHKIKSNVYIPKEMVQGGSRSAYYAIVHRLAPTLGKQIARYLPA